MLLIFQKREKSKGAAIRMISRVMTIKQRWNLMFGGEGKLSGSVLDINGKYQKWQTLNSDRDMASSRQLHVEQVTGVADVNLKG